MAQGAIQGQCEVCANTEATYSASGLAGAIVVADLKRDSHLDVIVSSQWDSSVFVWVNNGDGTLAQSHEYVTNNIPNSLLVGDINNDLHPDVVVAGTPERSAFCFTLPATVRPYYQPLTSRP